MVSLKKRAGRLLVLPCLILFCLVLSSCPASPDIPVPSVRIEADGATVNRGGMRPLRAATQNLDHVENRDVFAWTVASSEADPPGLGLPGQQTFVNAEGHLHVWRGDSRSYLDVQATMLFGPQIASEPFRVTLSDPKAAVEAITFTLDPPSVHRGGFVGIQAQVHWGDGPDGDAGGIPPTNGATGIVFTLLSGHEENEIILPGGGLDADHNTGMTLHVFRDQMPGLGAGANGQGIVVRAASIYDNFYIDIPIPVLQPVVTGITVTPPVFREGANGERETGVFRGEENTFSAEVHGLGYPFQQVEWEIVTGAGHPNFDEGSSIDSSGTLVLNEHCPSFRSGLPVTVRATSNFVFNDGDTQSATAAVTILEPVITGIQIEGGDTTMQRDTTRRFQASITSRGNPANFVIEWETRGTSTDQTEVTRMGFGHTGDLFLPPNEEAPSFTLRAYVRGNSGIAHAITVFAPDVENIVPGDWRAVAIGVDHMLALSWNNTMYSWGRNQWGRLGDSAIIPQGGMDRNVRWPTAIPNHHNLWREISGGSHHSIGIRQDGTLWAWGSNQHGQLGVRPGTMDNSVPTITNITGGPQVQSAPMPVAAARRFTWMSISAGMEHNVGIKVDGTLYSFGRNNFMQLGRELAPYDSEILGTPGEIRPHWAPGRITIEGVPDTGWRMAAAGGAHGAAIRWDGRLYTWGRNNHGQVGLGGTVGTNQELPVQVVHPGGLEWVYVAANDLSTLAIDRAGIVWTWGNNASGALGRMKNLFGMPLDNPEHLTNGNIPVPEPGPMNHPVLGRVWRSIVTSSGSQHAAAIDDLGHLYTWGRNHVGQLGWGMAYRRFDTSPAPNTVREDGTFTITVLPGSSAVGGFLTPEDREMLATPRQPMPDVRFMTALAGRWFTMAITEGGELWGWGDNRWGQIGNGQSFGNPNGNTPGNAPNHGPFPPIGPGSVELGLPPVPARPSGIGTSGGSASQSQLEANNRGVFYPVQIFRP